MNRPERVRGAFAFGLGAALVLAFFVVQHLRHGWPFSLHHGLTASGAPAPVDRVDSAATRPSHAGHRVPVDVPRDQLERYGIATVPLRREPLAGELRAPITVVPDEARVSHVHTRVSGWIERLAVNTTGETVRSGQVLASIFSQELLASQTEYLAVRTSAGSPAGDGLVHGARQRLAVLGMTDAEIAALERRNEPSRTVAIPAPRSGVVLHRGVTVGTSVDPSTELFTLADLSRVWILAEVPEARAAEVSVGAAASLAIPGSGRPPIEATVAFIYPALSERTRTLKVRFEVENRDGTLRPGMFGTASFTLAPRTAWVVPRDAIVDTGAEQHVFVERGEGRFEPRTVRLGARFADRVEVVEGLTEGDRVVASGVFLLDSESRLRASGGSGHAGHGAPSPPPSSAGEAAGGGPPPAQPPPAASTHTGHGH